MLFFVLLMQNDSFAPPGIIHPVIANSCSAYSGILPFFAKLYFCLHRYTFTFCDLALAPSGILSHFILQTHVLPPPAYSSLLESYFLPTPAYFYFLKLKSCPFRHTFPFFKHKVCPFRHNFENLLINLPFCEPNFCLF